MKHLLSLTAFGAFGAPFLCGALGHYSSLVHCWAAAGAKLVPYTATAGCGWDLSNLDSAAEVELVEGWYESESCSWIAVLEISSFCPPSGGACSQSLKLCPPAAGS